MQIDIIRYVEHIITHYNRLFNELDTAFKEAKIANYSDIHNKLHGFTIKEHDDNLYLAADETHYVYDYMKRDKVTKRVLIPLTTSVLTKQYCFGSLDIVPQNQEIITSTLDVIKQAREIIRALSGRISFYSGTKRIDIETRLDYQKNASNTIEFTIYYGDYQTKHLTFYIKERKFETVDGFTWDLVNNVTIPDNRIPDIIKRDYRTNILNIDYLSEEEKEIHEWHAEPEKYTQEEIKSLRRSRRSLWTF